MYSVLLFLFITVSESAYREPLFCYVTKNDSLETFNINHAPKVINCKNYMKKKMQTKQIILPWYFWDNNLRCYTIDVRVKLPHTNATSDLDIRMCAFKDRCDNFLEGVRVQMVMSSTVGIMKCSECYGNLCNSRITHDNLNIKVKKSVNPYRRNLYIGAGGCSVVGVIGALTRCLFCRKSKNNIPVNV